MKLTVGPLMPDGLPIDLNVDETWLAEQMVATGKSPGEIIADELDRALERGMKAMADDMMKAMEEMKRRAADQSTALHPDNGCASR